MSAPGVSARADAAAGVADVRAIVFDLGGTVLEIRHDDLAAIARRHGGAAAPGWVEAGERRGRVRVHHAAEAAAPGEETWRVFLVGMLEAAGVPAAAHPAAFEDIVAFHRAHHLWGREMPGMGGALRDLRARGYRVAAVSNSDGRAEALLTELALLDAFEFVIDSHDVGVEKPDPAIFALALARLGLPAAACAYVGDLTPVDVVGARSAGMRPVLFDAYDAYAGDAPFARAHGDAPRAHGAAGLLALFPGNGGAR